MLVLVDDECIALFLRDRNRCDFRIKKAALLCRYRVELRAQRHLILREAFDLEIISHVFRRFRHGIDAILRLHRFVDEAPADGGVVHRVGTAKRCFSLGHDERGATHALNAARNHHAGFA